jgi:hypothetical protein
MQHSPSWAANRSSATQEIPRILWKAQVHYRIHKSPPPVRILSQVSPIHVFHSNCLKIHWSDLRLDVQPGVSPSRFPTKTWCAFLFSPYMLRPPVISSTYKPWSSSLCSFSTPSYPHPSSPQHPILEHCQPQFLPECERLGFTPV